MARSGPEAAPAATVFRLVSESADATVAWGRRLGACLLPGLAVALHGELGAGKTTLVRGIVAGAGSRDRVTSPTFTFVNEYRTPAGWAIYHVDGYRLGGQAAGPEAAGLEAATIGLEELLADPAAVVLVEWAERVAGWLPPDHLSIALAPLPGAVDARRITCIASGETPARVLACAAASPQPT
jgi:tRNA threonylcarbamoyladenosine biosynthesis protein TsaE